MNEVRGAVTGDAVAGVVVANVVGPNTGDV